MAPRRGRRDNGLQASYYVPLRDVDPRVGEHLLDLLREAGIAAYLEPTSDVDSYTRAVSLPSPPSDRLWVDRSARPDASSLVADHADDPPGTPAVAVAAVTAPVGHRAGGSDAGEDVIAELDEKALWEQIVAGWDRDGDSPVPRWPAQEGLDAVGHVGADHLSDHDTDDPDGDDDADDDEPDHAATPVRRVAAPVPDPDDHYRPPPPPPVPRLQRHTVGALFVIVLGITMLFAPGVIGFPIDVSFVLGVLGIVGGMGFLVYRMRERLPFDEGPDDGAVV